MTGSRTLASSFAPVARDLPQPVGEVIDQRRVADAKMAGDSEYLLGPGLVDRPTSGGEGPTHRPISASRGSRRTC